MTRQQANIEILRLLAVVVAYNPQLRFGQLLINYNIAPANSEFFVESTETLEKLRDAIGEK